MTFKENSEVNNILIIMTKWPAFGRCKTRLAASIGRKSASIIQSQLINHTVTVARTIGEIESLNIHLSISGLGPFSAIRYGKTLKVNRINNQSHGSLGLRMRKQIAEALYDYNLKERNSIQRVIIIGTDLPRLTTYDLFLAIQVLKTKEMVLGPSTDGGYWLIGFSGNLTNDIPLWPFENMPWGGSRLLDKTISIAKSKNINLGLIREHNDIDLIDDLNPWLSTVKV
tara:strand:+ start:12 stop:692 length:681 start_codon:yes stop_codon:yes gene_type:complete